MVKIEFKKIKPTIFLKDENGRLKQKVLLELENQGSEPVPAFLFVHGGSTDSEQLLGMLPPGESARDVYIDELQQPAEFEFILKTNETVASRVRVFVTPPRHWVVHVVQSSHHDVGYTDLASRVLLQHDQFLDQALDHAEATDSFPEEARFRIVIEQAWSIDHYLKQAPPQRAARMIERLRQGHFELTALFGNMTSELCSHETLVRTLYHSARLKRKHGIPILSAEHNDIPGISWGVARILTDAGIKLFCPGLPLYYDWGNLGMQSFWDQQMIFGHAGPGAFWWEACTGKRILFWCNNSGCGGDSRTDLPVLTEMLQEWEGSGYPYSVMRWPVIGAERDNSPYRVEYAETVKAWNERWAYPRLVCSTNTGFYQDFVQQIPVDLPVWRGELAGQDYPVGATSTAKATAINRASKAAAPGAEKLAVFAALALGHEYPQELLFDAYEAILWHDEHSWGHHFPAGPAVDAAETEKALHAYRASGFVHEAANKAMAAIADQVRLEDEGLHLVVFNPLGIERAGVVRAPLREIDNLGSTISERPANEDERGSGHLRGVLLGNRWHVNPPLEIAQGKFDLVDLSSGERLTFQIVEIDSTDPTPYAAQRAGLGAGTRRYGMFEEPLGIRRDLCFIVQNVPAHGYKTFRLAPRQIPPEFGNPLTTQPVQESERAVSIENEFYRVTVGTDKTGEIEIFDKVTGRGMVDHECPHGFAGLVVRKPGIGQEYLIERTAVRKVLEGPVCWALEITGRIFGHPQVTQRISLYAGIQQVWVDVRILKDATPLLDAQIAFPFRVEQPVFRYEGGLSFMNPIRDYLPGSYSDAVTVQNWVQAGGKDGAVLWSSLDAPVVGLGGLWPGYVSPAHRAYLDEQAQPRTTHREGLNPWLDLFEGVLQQPGNQFLGVSGV